MFGHTQAGRMCPGWFAAAGLRDLRVIVKPGRISFAGAETMRPHPMDLLPWTEGDVVGYSAYYRTEYGEMIRDGLIDAGALERAMEEARVWFRNPGAFHFHVTVTVAGRV
jgi:hypothetical protein